MIGRALQATPADVRWLMVADGREVAREGLESRVKRWTGQTRIYIVKLADEQLQTPPELAYVNSCHNVATSMLTGIELPFHVERMVAETRHYAEPPVMPTPEPPQSTIKRLNQAIIRLKTMLALSETNRTLELTRLLLAALSGAVVTIVAAYVSTHGCLP